MGIPETVRTGPQNMARVKGIRITGETPEGGFEAQVTTEDGGKQLWKIRPSQVTYYLKGTIEKKIIYD